MALNDAAVHRIAESARTAQWSVVVTSGLEILATQDSGVVGFPWAVIARRGGRGYRVSLYRPGDDLGVEGESCGDLEGSPRDQGRQLREILVNLDLSASS